MSFSSSLSLRPHTPPPPPPPPSGSGSAPVVVPAHASQDRRGKATKGGKELFLDRELGPEGGAASSQTPIPAMNDDPATGIESEAVGDWKGRLWEAAIPQWSLFVPSALENICWQVELAGTLMIVGHRLGAENFEGVSTALTVYNICTSSIGIGLLGALETLAAQAYGRNPKSKEIGELSQRAFILTIVLLLPCFVFLSYSRFVLGLVFSPLLANRASQFLSRAHVLLFLTMYSFCMATTINSCRLTHLPLIASICSAAVALVGAYFFLETIPDAVAVLTAVQITQFVVLTGFIIFHPGLEGMRRATWLPSKAMLRRLLRWVRVKEFMKVAIPAMISCCAEWWAFESMVVTAGLVSDTAVGTVAICLSTNLIFFVTPGAISVAATITVGNALGADDPQLAKASSAIAMLTMFVNQFFVTFVALFFFHRQIFSFFTADPTLLRELDRVAPLLVTISTVDGIQYVIQGLYCGVGYQDRASKRVLFSLWAVGVLGSYIMAVRMGWGAFGVLCGMVLGLSVETPLLVLGARGWDWEALAHEASMEREESGLEALADGENSPCLSGRESDDEEYQRIVPAATASVTIPHYGTLN